MTAHIAYFVFLRRSAKNMAAKFKGRALITRLQVIFIFGIKPPFKRWSEEEKCQEVTQKGRYSTFKWD